jgi:hypothetical protein
MGWEVTEDVQSEKAMHVVMTRRRLEAQQKERR